MPHAMYVDTVEECVEPDTHGNAVWPFSKPPIRGVKRDLHEDTNHLDLGRSGAGDVS
jgi:hypothetical protein